MHGRSLVSSTNVDVKRNVNEVCAWKHSRHCMAGKQSYLLFCSDSVNDVHVIKTDITFSRLELQTSVHFLRCPITLCPAIFQLGE